MGVIQLELSADVLEATKLTEADLRVELASALYAHGHLSFGKAREIAELDVYSFMKALGAREIPMNYDEEAWEQDLKTLERLRP